MVCVCDLHVGGFEFRVGLLEFMGTLLDSGLQLLGELLEPSVGLLPICDLPDHVHDLGQLVDIRVRIRLRLVRDADDGHDLISAEDWDRHESRHGRIRVHRLGIANGRQPFVGIESDGSLQMNLQELATLRGQNLPVRLFIINNNGYASIRNTQRNYFQGRYVGTGPEGGLFLPDIVAVAQSMGISASRVSDAADLREAVRRTLAQTGPVILDVQVQNDETLWPKSAALPQPDGSMLSMPLEDMSPLLPRAELREQMLVPLAPESEKVVD